MPKISAQRRNQVRWGGAGVVENIHCIYEVLNVIPVSHTPHIELNVTPTIDKIGTGEVV